MTRNCRNTLVGLTLIGAMLMGAKGAQAAQTFGDWTIKLDVKLALLNQLGEDSWRVNVDATGGAVTLTGTVASPQALAQALAVAQSVTGVTRVQNGLRVGANALPQTGPVAPAVKPGRRGKH